MAFKCEGGSRGRCSHPSTCRLLGCAAAFFSKPEPPLVCTVENNNLPDSQHLISLPPNTTLAVGERYRLVRESSNLRKHCADAKKKTDKWPEWKKDSIQGTPDTEREVQR